MIEHCVNFLEEEKYLIPDEKYCLIRSMPHLMLLADGDSDVPKSFNIFKTKLVNLQRLQKLFKRYPYVPEIGDMSISILLILARAQHYDEPLMNAQWKRKSDKSTFLDHYSLTARKWKKFREDHLCWMSDFSDAMNRVNCQEGALSKSPSSAELCTNVGDLTLRGLKIIRDMTCAVVEQHSWKLNHPVSLKTLRELGVDEDKLQHQSAGFSYECAVRFNYDSTELSVLVDVISMIKSVSSNLTKSESALAPLIRLYIHNNVQILVQRDMAGALHRADKKKKRTFFKALVQIRNIAIDWLGGHRQDDYRLWKKSNPPAEIPARVVGPTPTQLSLMRTMIRALYDENSDARATRGLFSARDLGTEEVKILENFHKNSLYFPYLLGLSSTVSEISDLSDLWYREFYLEITKQVQFPIAMSLPWILTEHVINHVAADAPLIEDLASTMDVYNDAAQRALYNFKCQFIYDEVQAEVNLAFDQLVFAISDETYTYHKDLAAALHLPNDFKSAMECAKGAPILTKRIRRFAIPTNQRNFRLLGRSINLSLLVSQHASNKLYDDIELCVKRYETSNLSHICELRSTLKVLRSCHGFLMDSGLTLDEFDSMLDKVNMNAVGANFASGGRIALHTLRALVTDVFPNYSYNMHTKRYYPAPVVYRPVEWGSKCFKNATGNLGYGSMCHRAYESINKSTRGFLGRPHLNAIVEILGHQYLSFLIEECLKNLDLQVDDLSVNVSAIREGLPPAKLPKYIFRTGGCYGYFEGKLKPLQSYANLKSNVFQSFREVGNAMFFFRDISNLIDGKDRFSFAGASPYSRVDYSSKSSGVSYTGNGGGYSTGYSEQNTITSSPLHYTLGEFKKSEGETSQIADGLRGAHEFYGTKEGTNRGRSVFKTAIARTKEAIWRSGIARDWGATSSTTSGALDTENSSEFHRLFSVLNFLFCMNEHKGGDKEELTDEEEFGNGFAMTGILVMQILNQRSSFELLDLSYHLLSVCAHELCSTGKSDPKIGSVDENMQIRTDHFIVTARRQRSVHLNIFSVLATSNDGQIPPSINLTTFHPPANDKEFQSIPSGTLKITANSNLIDDSKGSTLCSRSEHEEPFIANSVSKASNVSTISSTTALTATRSVQSSKTKSVTPPSHRTDEEHNSSPPKHPRGALSELSEEPTKNSTIVVPAKQIDEISSRSFQPPPPPKKAPPAPPAVSDTDTPAPTFKPPPPPKKAPPAPPAV